MKAEVCYCDTGLDFAACCQPYLVGQAEAPTAAALMRSRYSAFVTENLAYLKYSWHPDDCPADLKLEPNHWIGLKVLNHGEYIPAKSAWVHFVARYKVGGKAHRIEERSLFSVSNGRWYYRHPDPLDTPSPTNPAK